MVLSCISASGVLVDPFRDAAPFLHVDIGFFTNAEQWYAPFGQETVLFVPLGCRFGPRAADEYAPEARREVEDINSH